MIQIPKVSPLFKRGLGGFFGNWNLYIICDLKIGAWKFVKLATEFYRDITGSSMGRL
jgi:hypothetical protein